MGATVHRNMPPEGTVYGRGEKPGYTTGMWFTHCTECGHFRRGPHAYFHNPVDAQRIADRHNEKHHGEQQ